MAVLTEQDLADVFSEYMRRASAEHRPIILSKVQIEAGVAAWATNLDAILTALNDMLPTAARSGLTATDKVDVFVFLLQRWLIRQKEG